MQVHTGTSLARARIRTVTVTSKKNYQKYVRERHDVRVLIPKNTTNLKFFLKSVYKCTANPHILQYTVVDTRVGKEIPEINLGRLGGWLEG